MVIDKVEELLEQTHVKEYFMGFNLSLKDILINHVDPRDFMYWIDVAKFGVGFTFGEQAILSNKIRSVTIKCTQNCIFAVIGKTTYDKCISGID